ncbi:MAG: hypothetical protein J4452_01860 [Candidatus Aenigmarchaeota archaeon]|nr:hypothetical protein [Candidatus Aenigmarchaeota archaeon]
MLSNKNDGEWRKLFEKLGLKIKDVIKEISRVFDLEESKAKQKLAELEKQKKVKSKLLAGQPHWFAKS